MKAKELELYLARAYTQHLIEVPQSKHSFFRLRENIDHGFTIVVDLHEGRRLMAQVQRDRRCHMGQCCNRVTL